MTISGGMKFFDEIKNLATLGTLVTAGTGNASAPNMLDRNRLSLWRSVGSSDATTETITITLPAAASFNRIFLVGHNFKSFDIMYDNSGYTHFSNVVGLDGALANLTETVFADNTGYWEFNAVSATVIRIRVTTTQVANQEKFLNQVILCTELGTLNGYPEISCDLMRNKRKNAVLGGRYNIDEALDTLSIDLKFRNYPTADPYPDDIDLMFTLNERNQSFLAWPCGGRRGTSYFKHANIRGFRLQDIEVMKIENELKPKFEKGVFVNGIQMDVQMVEAP